MPCKAFSPFRQSSCVCSASAPHFWCSTLCVFPLTALLSRCCCVQVSQSCASGVVDAHQQCCPSGLLDRTATCCPPGAVVDGAGQCCPGGAVLDACGVCNGNGEVVNVQGQCCASVVDAAGVCSTVEHLARFRVLFCFCWA